MLVVHQMFHEGAAKPLHHRADDLSAQCERIDDPPAILDHHVVDEFHVAELGIDRHMGGVGAVGVGVLFVEKCAFRRDAFACEPRERD